MIMIFFNILRVRAINLNEAAFCNGKVIDSIFNLTLITALNEVQKLKCFHFKILWLSRLYQYAALNCKKHDELPSSIENIGTKAAQKKFQLDFNERKLQISLNSIDICSN